MKKIFFVLCVLLYIIQSPAVAQNSTVESAKNQNWEIIQQAKLGNDDFWRYFVEVTSIPRCSGNEQAIAEYIAGVARTHGLSTVRDKHNNVLVRVPGTPGYESAPVLCFQSHSDIVCQTRDGSPMPAIRFMMDGDSILRANQTTLGADDGVGVAMMLCLMTVTMPHAPLELYFTAGEETGFTGAKGFDYTLIKSRELYNLDAEDLNELVIGCAGYQMVETTGLLEYESTVGDGDVFVVNFSGFAGGHSGVDIHKNNGNALEAMFYSLIGLQNNYGARVLSLTGGGVVNTIPREASVTVGIPDSLQAELMGSVQEVQNVIRSVHSNPKITVQITQTPSTGPERVMTFSGQERLLDMLYNLPIGVIALEADERLVRTSNNLGALEVKGEVLMMKNMFRSSSATDLESTAQVLIDVTSGYSSKVIGSGVPWEPDFDSPLVTGVRAVYAATVGGDMKVATIHAGTENGVFVANIPGLQTVAIGCGVHNMHTPDELLLVKNVAPWYKFICALAAQK